MTLDERNCLILENIELAERIAKRKRWIYPISYDELKSAAYMGLVEAAKSFKPAENDSFPKFAIRRIVGAIQDYLRSLSWSKREHKKKAFSFNCEKNDIIYFNTEVIQREFDYFLDELTKFCSDVQKMVIRLFFVEGKEINDIAEHLKLNKFRIVKILKDIRTNLKATWEHRYNELLLMCIKI